MTPIKLTSSWVLVFFISQAFSSSARANPFYDYEIIGATGQAGLVAIPGEPSINALGDVAFVGTLDSTFQNSNQSIFVGDGLTGPTNITPSLNQTSLFFFPRVQINSSSEVIGAWTLFTFPQPSSLNIWDAQSVDAATNIVTFPPGGPNVAIADTAISESGDVAFYRDQPGPGTTLSTPDGSGGFNGVNLPAGVPLDIASDGRILYRGGGVTGPTIVATETLGDIRLISNDLSSEEIVVSFGTFARLGFRPAVSEDGNTVVFGGELTQANADAINLAQNGLTYADGSSVQPATLRPGPGIFYSVQTDAGRIIGRLAGLNSNGILDPGETFQDVNTDGIFNSGDVELGVFWAFDINEPLAISGFPATTRSVSVAIPAPFVGGISAIYQTRLNSFGTRTSRFDIDRPGQWSVRPPSKVIAVGDSIPGVGGTVTSIDLNDALNSRDRGDVAFQIETTSGVEAVVRARPNEVVYIDFEPTVNFVLDPITEALFATTGAQGDWQGDFSNVLSALAPDRPELLGANIPQIQLDIVQKVRAIYEELEPASGVGVNVKVLGPQDSLPAEGPVIRLYIGDGPNGPLIRPTKLGLAPVNLFNDNRNFGLGSTSEGWVAYQPLVFADNIFRVNTMPMSGAFSNEDPNNPQFIGLNDLGPNQITVDEVSTAVAFVAAHELGHSLGLAHLLFDQSGFLMKERVETGTTSTSGMDDLRVLPRIGNQPVQLSTRFADTGQTENGGARLAFNVGSDTDSPALMRELPSAPVRRFQSRYAYSTVLNLSGPDVSVVSAGLGVVRAGYEDSFPELISLGSGLLSDLLDVDLGLAEDDAIIVFASTDGLGIDVIGVSPAFGGSLNDIDTTSSLSVLVTDVIRGDAFDQAGAASSVILDIWLDDAASGFQLIGQLGGTGAIVDFDDDGVADPLDNCQFVANADQRDTNADGFGNVCDPDLNDDLVVNFIDLGLMRALFFTSNSDADLDGDGIVNFVDLGILRSFFFLPPGPSGLAQL